MEVMESDPMGFYNLRCRLPHTWLYLDPNLITTYQKTGPISYTAADNEQLVGARESDGVDLVIWGQSLWCFPERSLDAF